MSPRKSSKTTQTLSGAIAVVVLFFIALAYQAISGGSSTGSTPTPSAPVSANTGTSSGSWYSLYFTDPHHPDAANLRGGPDEALAAAIDGAKLTVDVAVYELDLFSIRDALLRAHRRGVTVRMVTDSDYTDNEEVQELMEAGIEVLGDRREGLMHNKFTIIDRQEVWGGSMNYTVNDAYKNNNNLIRIRSSRLAENYTTEFEEMFTEDLFGPADRPATPYPSLTVEGTRIEVLFSPDDRPAARVVEWIASAETSVYFMAFSFTSDDISAAMQERAEAGVTVAGVFEESQVKSNTGDEYDALRAAGLDVRLDGNNRNMHHKVIVIDERIVIFGSYNFSASAETKNDENLVIVDNPAIAALFMSEFQRVFAEAGE